MCDPTSKEERWITARKILWLEAQISQVITRVIKGHHDHHKSAQHIN